MSKTIKDLEPERLALSEDTILEDNVENFQEIEETPEVQYGLDNRNLDHIYKGHNPAHYGLHLRRWIFGENGLSTDMITPQRTMASGRAAADSELVLKFFSNS